MNKLKFSNLAVFVLFFGLALVEAIQNRGWIEAVLFMALGIMSLWADFHKKQ
jgi:hypothetical protein